MRLDRVRRLGVKALSLCEFRVGWVELEGAILGCKAKGSDGNDDAHNEEGAI